MGSSFDENPSGLKVQSNHPRGRNSRVLNILHSLSSYLLETWGSGIWLGDRREVGGQSRKAGLNV